jgi:hypothetical protein
MYYDYELDDNKDYIVNLPLIEQVSYLEDEEYYNSKLIRDALGLQLEENRAISDDIELRMNNTAYISSLFLEDLTVQKYTFGLQLPLNLKIHLIIKKDVVLYKNLNLEDEISILYFDISKYLLTQQTGTRISFYRTKIVDICHNYEWVKSVYVTLYDGDDILISSGNLETYPIRDLIDDMNKDKVLDFTPPYFWWNLNNIDITHELDG